MSASTATPDAPSGGAHRAAPAASPGAVARRFAAVLQRAVLDRLPLVGMLGALSLGMGLLVGGLWPSLEDTFGDLSADIRDLLANALSGADITTAAGWANAEFVSLVAPAAVIAAAVAAVSGGIAGEEQRKTLGVLLSAPLSRTTFLLAKAAAMVVLVVLVSATVALGLVAATLVGDMGLTTAGVTAVGLHSAALGLFFGGLALLVSGLSGDSRLTVVITAALAVSAFLATVVIGLLEDAGDWARLTPWHYFNSSNPLVNGADAAHLLVLLAGAVLLGGAAVLGYRRRDLRG